MSSDERPSNEPESAPLAVVNDATCRSVRERSAAFAAGTGELATGADLRAHLARCPQCRDVYREDLQIAAHIGRRRRAERFAAEREFQRGRFKRFVLSFGDRPRRFFVRTLLLPGLVLFLIARGIPTSVTTTVHAVNGSYQLGARTLATEAPRQPLRRGDWIVTDETSSASVERSRRAWIEIGPSTRLLVADRDLGRFLLDLGSITVKGEALINTPWGAAEIRGTASLRVDEHTLEVEVQRGSARLIDADGAREIGSGERSSLPASGL